jgi:ketosteroid isomerase-like protein
MVKGMSLLFVFVLTCSAVFAQNSNSSTTSQRPRTSNTNRAKPPASEAEQAAPAPAPKQAAKKPGPDATGSEGVLAAFDALIDGIRHANVKEVTDIYWNDPRLNLFNYNGTVTKGWEQVRKNRESSYPEIKDVKLEVRDRSVTMLGTNAALVTCQWTQAQTYKGVPETAAGRMTLVFKRVGMAWKAIHLHSSPDTPNPASIPPSEQRPAPSPSPTP